VDKSCRIFPGQFDGDLRFDPAHDFQGQVRFFKWDPILLTPVKTRLITFQPVKARLITFQPGKARLLIIQPVETRLVTVQPGKGSIGSILLLKNRFLSYSQSKLF